MKALLLSLVLALPMSSAQAAPVTVVCRDLFRAYSAVNDVVSDDAYQQWLVWEQTANVEIFRKPTTTLQVPVAKISADSVTVRTTPHAPAELIGAFVHQGYVLWPQHPYNTASEVPYKDEPAVGKIPVYMTSSRSLALNGSLRGFTLKLATNYPHGPKGGEQRSKIKTNDDIDSALLHTNHVETIDAELGSDPTFALLGEVMTVAEKKTGIGMVVRDVRLLDDSHYYLPALSIPFVGRDIARLNGEEFGPFWEKHFAQALGEVKARLLLRYGLQMLTPNAQNILVQLDRDLRPTGKLILRDISDAYLVDAVATGLGYDEQIKLDNAVEYPPKKEVKPYWSNSSWRMDEAGAKSVPDDMLLEWGRAHNAAYIGYIEKELGVNFKISAFELRFDEFQSIYQWFTKNKGQEALKAYRQRRASSQAPMPTTSESAPTHASFFRDLFRKAN